jgi:predicted acetyltransferase
VVLLAAPDVRFHRSFLAAADEFRVVGQGVHDGILNWPAEGDFPGVVFTREGLEDPDEFARLVANRVGDAEEGSLRPPGWTSATHLWMADPDQPDEFVGAISLRHSIEHPMLASVGGHVGYGVRPSARRRGFASDALSQVVPLAAARGIPRLLVTCDLDNVASARTIESNGGQFEGELRGKRRYWISTGARVT